MSDHLTSFIFKQNTKPSIVKPSLELQEGSVTLNDAERHKIRKLIQRARFDILIVLPSFHAKLGILQPPTGYVATLHKDSIFHSDVLDRNIFRTVAMVPLQRKVRYSDVDIDSFFRRLNTMMRDSSTLGPNAWVGIYECKSNKRNLPKFNAIVVSALTDAQYLEFYELCQSMDGQCTIEEASQRAIPYREMARNNRIRALQMVQLAASEISKHVKTNPDVPKPALEWCGDTPHGVVIPSRSVRNCPPLPTSCSDIKISEWVPEEIEGMEEWCMDEMGTIRRAGVMRGTSKHVQLRGPTQEIVLIEGGKTEWVGTCGKYTVGHTPVEGCTDKITWEDDTLIKNRLMHTVYEELPLTEDAIFYEPVMVRLSCVGEDGMTMMDTVGIKRLIGFCFDSYIPI